MSTSDKDKLQESMEALIVLLQEMLTSDTSPLSVRMEEVLEQLAQIQFCMEKAATAMSVATPHLFNAVTREDLENLEKRLVARLGGALYHP